MTCHDVISLMADDMHACVFLFVKHFSLLIMSMENIKRDGDQKGGEPPIWVYFFLRGEVL